MKKEVVLVLALLISLPLVTAECDSEKGGVQIEDKCYECGKLDDVCPEDFGADCKVIDPDCNFICKLVIQFLKWIKELIF